jgi:hypothetical protein
MAICQHHSLSGRKRAANLHRPWKDGTSSQPTVSMKSKSFEKTAQPLKGSVEAFHATFLLPVLGLACWR